MCGAGSLQQMALKIRFDIVLLFVGVTLPKSSLSISSDGHKLLQSLNEFYIFKPIQAGNDGFASSVSTLISEDFGAHMQKTSVSFLANNTLYELELELNEDFLPDHFTTSYSLEDGTLGHRTQTKKEINNCFYHGFVKGRHGSQVVASTCHGFRGTIFLPGDILQFAPVDENKSMHALYRPKSTLEQSCGNFYFKSFHNAMTDLGDNVRLKRETKEKKFIELLVVADNEEFNKFEDREELHNHVKEVVNRIDALYKKLDLRVVLLHIEVWENGDKIESDDDPQNVLAEFLQYRQERIQNTDESSPWRYTDNAQLLFGGNFKGTTVGMATVSTMCSIRSGGVNEDKKDPDRTAATVAHEMGHNLGMSHDTEKCVCDGRKCVMAATVSTLMPAGWSDCSVDYLDQGYKSGMANCLVNVPDSTRLFGGPQCGNGIVEKDEQCDCGLIDDCQSKCCNATTCQLHTGAQCDDGACCTPECNFKSTCSLCRPTGNDCDIAEYCTGHSAHCPGNIHKIDGMDCRNRGGICYGGVCRSHEMQCQEVWGPAAANGDNQCYLSVNKKGDLNGNCGKHKGVFTACTPENAICGKLQCTGGEQFPLIASDRVFYRNRFADFVCKSISSVNHSTDAGDPGLVWDGTKCGEGKMCFAGVCANVTTVLKSCSSDCSGRGICNNFGNCHCEKGWAPPDCSRKGDGGSFDSGPICVDSTDMQVVLMLVFFLVILPLILGFVFFVWWRYCGGKYKFRVWRKNRQYKRGKSGERNPDTGDRSHVAEARTVPPTRAVPATRPDKDFHMKPAVHNSPARPPPPSRPSPRLPIRNAPPPPRPVNALPPQRPPNPMPPSRPSNPMAPPPRPAVAAKPRLMQPAYQPPPPRPGGDPDSSVSIQDRIARLQRNNVV